MFDLKHDFFKPFLRRAVTTLVVTGWAAFELISGAVGWGMLFAALALWCAYTFFIDTGWLSDR